MPDGTQVSQQPNEGTPDGKDRRRKENHDGDIGEKPEPPEKETEDKLEVEPVVIHSVISGGVLLRRKPLRRRLRIVVPREYFRQTHNVTLTGSELMPTGRTIETPYIANTSLAVRRVESESLNSGKSALADRPL